MSNMIKDYKNNVNTRDLGWKFFFFIEQILIIIRLKYPEPKLKQGGLT